MTNYYVYVTESNTSIPLIHVSNSSGPVNTPVILYDACTSYINVALKKYLYLFLYNSSRHNNAYEFKNLDLYPGCEKEHNKGKVVGQCIKGSYYIKCQSSPNKKEIKINISPEMISSITHQASRNNPTYNHTYFCNKTLHQYSTLYRKFSSKNFDYYSITDKTSYSLCELGYDDDKSIA
ncbi:hypothetical protein RclHR1_03690003 [Rhizophagus clarus]|nr:hypothetical protein RclHR1_03690003 [Rhizophagus clarus]